MSNSARDKLLLLADSLANDVLEASDAEIVQETVDAGFAPDEVAEQFDSLLADVTATVGKRRLEDARTSLRAARQRRGSSNVLRFSAARKRQILDVFAGKDQVLRERLTLAARKSDGTTDDEVDSILANLVDLGAIDDEGNAL